MKSAIKLIGIIALTAIIGFFMMSCNNGVGGGSGGGAGGSSGGSGVYRDDEPITFPKEIHDNSNTEFTPSIKAKPFYPTTGSDPKIIDSYTDGTNNYYLLDVGYVKDVYISTLAQANYTGVPLNISKTITETSQITNSLTETITNTYYSSYTGSDKVGVGTEWKNKFNFFGLGSELTVKANFEWTWQNTTSDTNTKSMANTHTTTTAYAEAQTISYSFGLNNHPVGRYRYAIYSDIDVYYLITTSMNNETLLDWEIVTCARPNSYTLSSEYSLDGNFSNESDSFLEFTNDFYKHLVKPILPPAPPVQLNHNIVTTTFQANVWAENQNLGLGTFHVTGIKVRYNDKEYVYGNAWYQGTLGGVRFNDVDTISLRGANRSILMGGTLHWQGTINDNNESGIAGWNRGGATLNGFNAYYLVEDPTKDFAANEEVKISITDICVELPTAAADNTVPEIVTTNFSSDIFCESTNSGKLNFDVIGIKVKYNGSYYVMGNAWHSGTPGSSRFNDVDQIELRNSSLKILFGGTLHWQGTVNDFNESGVAGFDRNGGFDSTTIKYMVEDPSRDFAANKNNRISITGICVRLGDVDSNADLVPEIAATSFTAQIQCEGSFSGSATFNVTGVKVKYNAQDYIYGNAFFSGTPGGSRFNDVDQFMLKDTTKDVLLGGTLHWRPSSSLGGGLADNNESGVAGFANLNETNKNIQRNNLKFVRYMIEDPGKDFVANKRNRISITGICVRM